MKNASSSPAKCQPAPLETGWPIAARVMMHCIRARYDEKRAADLPRTLRAEPEFGELSWLALITVATQHTVIGLLHFTLQKAEQLEAKTASNGASQATTPLISAEIRAAVGNAVRSNLTYNLMMTRELLALSEMFESAKLPHVPFKGPLLAEEVYGGLGMRQFIDIDILVPQNEVLRAKKLLQERGYVIEDPLPPALEAAYLRGDTVYEMARADGAYALELHWAVTLRSLPFCFSFDDVKANLRRVRLAGTEIPTIAPEELLLILCVHGTKHVWERLGWICDVAEVLRVNPDLDWKRVFERAKRLRCRKMLALGLLLARDMVGQAPPAPAAAWLETQKDAAPLSSEVQNRFSRLFTSQNEGQELERIGGNRSDDMFFLKTLETRADQGRFLWHLVSVPNATERARVPIPSSLSFLWCVIRPSQLLWKYAGVGLGRVLGRRD